MKDGLPIWLILEDDAHFTPNFKMKLDAILKILPLDFHICQIGYSRPRNALLKDYGKSNLISIPSFTFFLTGKRKKESTFFLARKHLILSALNLQGYILSRAGAQFLLSQLPINGPIDLWINTLRHRGLKGYVSNKFLLWQEYDVGWRAKDSDVFFSGHAN